MTFGKWLIRMILIVAGFAVSTIAYGIDTPPFMSWPWIGAVLAPALIVWGTIGFPYPQEREK